MTEFLEFNTEGGNMLFNMDEISHVKSIGSGTQTVLYLKNGDYYYVVNEEYDSVVGFIQWVADGRPEIEHSPDCPDKNINKN